MSESDGAVTGAVRTWLRMEGLAVLGLAVLIYGRADYSWLWFAVLFLAPDASFLAYLAGSRIGAAVYNGMHSYVAPASIAAILVATADSVAIPLIWCAHIGFDRVLGYGLKYPTAFSATHLGVIGRRRVAESR